MRSTFTSAAKPTQHPPTRYHTLGPSTLAHAYLDHIFVIHSARVGPSMDLRKGNLKKAPRVRHLFSKEVRGIGMGVESTVAKSRVTPRSERIQRLHGFLCLYLGDTNLCLQIIYGMSALCCAFPFSPASHRPFSSPPHCIPLLNTSHKSLIMISYALRPPGCNAERSSTGVYDAEWMSGCWVLGQRCRWRGLDAH